MPRFRRSALAALPLFALPLVAVLGACQSDGGATGSIDTPSDLRARHPIVLAQAPRILDVFPTGPGQLDPRQTADVAGFLLEYRRQGRGALVAQVPGGDAPGASAAAARTLHAIRRLVAESGLPAAALVVEPYPVANPSVASAVRLSFQQMQAKVADACGLWPEDLGVSDYSASAKNGPYHNFGCAMQTNVAAQVADPIDLVRGRAEARIDTVRRVKVIDGLRDGKDPSTQWRQDGQSSVKQQVSQ